MRTLLCLTLVLRELTGIRENGRFLGFTPLRRFASSMGSLDLGNRDLLGVEVGLKILEN